MKTVRSLFGVHKGKSCGVIGGAYTLHAQLRGAKKTDIKIAVNEHALHLIDCDYVCYWDREPSRKILSSKAKRVSRYPAYADYYATEGVLYYTLYTFEPAVDLAIKMGCCPIHLYGMDCFVTDARYCDGYTRAQAIDESKTMHRDCLRQLKDALDTSCIKGADVLTSEIFGGID